LEDASSEDPNAAFFSKVDLTINGTGSSILISGGKYNIVTGGGSANAPEKVKEDWGNPMGKQDDNTAALI
jgi:hypothetical protein